MAELSNFMKHVNRELGLLADGSEEQARINRDIRDVMSLIDKQGHSGFSLAYLLSMINRLGKWENIKPLTGESEEWGTEASPNQNNRRPSVFRDPETGISYDVDEYSFTDDDGKSWFYNGNILEHTPIIFPYSGNNKKYVYLDEEHNVLKIEEV